MKTVDELCHGFTEQRLAKEEMGRSDDEIQPDPTDEGINRELPRSDCFADSTPLGFNTLLQGAGHLGRLTSFACKSLTDLV